MAIYNIVHVHSISRDLIQFVVNDATHFPRTKKKKKTDYIGILESTNFM